MITILASIMLSTNVSLDKSETLTPVGFNHVTLEDNFWFPRLKIQKDVLLPFALDKVKPSIDNLVKTASFLQGDTTSKPAPQRYIASDLYKIMEGAAYILHSEKDKVLEASMDSIIDIIAEAQAQDGYHYESHITGVAKDYKYGYWGGAGMGDKPYSWVLHSHELYNMGHMYEGAIAYFQATGKRKWLDVAIKNANHVNKVFFEGDPNYNNGKPVNQAPGHQGIELALVKLFRVTKDSAYLKMAKKFLDIRGITFKTEGKGVMSGEYSQQHLPVRLQYKAVGHSVRAMYMYSGMADVSGLYHDETLEPALDSIWHNIVDTRMHITGGLGAVHGIEGFGPEYLLPNKEAYLETCAAVGNVLFNHRMFLAKADSKYMDVVEVALYNNVLAGVNIEGNKFFYVNPLEADGETPFNHGRCGRSPWFGTACCPSNLARLLPQVAGMMYATRNNDLFVSLYATSSSEQIQMKNGNIVVSQKTDYPFDGTIKIKVDSLSFSDFSIRMRIPSWVNDQFVPGKLYTYSDHNKKSISVKLNGKSVPFFIEKGFAVINRSWKNGDVVQLTLPMEVRFSIADDRVEADQNQVAVTRGPLLFCAETSDNKLNLHNLFIDGQIQEKGVKCKKISSGILKGILSLQLCNGLTMIPYYAWNNRGDQAMLVWFPKSREKALKNLDENEEISSFKNINAFHTYSLDSPQAIGDGILPASSSDSSIPRWTSYPQIGKKQWVEIGLLRTIPLRSIGIYWYDDNGGVRVPKEWILEYRNNGNWQKFDIYTTDQFENRKDQFNIVHPASELNTDALRILITPQPDAAVGILEVNVTQE